MPDFRLTPPEDLMKMLSVLRDAGHETYIVGGAVRDALLGVVPHDWDVATSATPDKVLELFPKHSVPTGLQYGTVSIMAKHEHFEVTTYRADGKYLDGRRPTDVRFSTDIKEDLARRDFTMNAMAYNPFTNELVDPFGGQLDITYGSIRCVGDPKKRFMEDALRIMRIPRFCAQHKMRIAKETGDAARELSYLVVRVAPERICDELTKMLTSSNADLGMLDIEYLNLLHLLFPMHVLQRGLDGGKYHKYNVYTHTLRALEWVMWDHDLVLSLAALYHDIGKPACMTRNENGDIHFYDHDEVGAEIAEQELVRLRFPNAVVAQVKELVREHMFPTIMGKPGIRRLMHRISSERQFARLVALKQADMLAQGVADMDNYSNFMHRVNELKDAKEDNIVLAFDGNDIMDLLHCSSGPLVGKVKRHLMNMVMDNPIVNNFDTLRDEAFRFATQKEYSRVHSRA